MALLKIINIGLIAKKIIENLPENILVSNLGPLPHNKVANAFRGNHLFLFPTLGENFGHAVIESLSVGCPVLISDKTPWRYLNKKGVGDDLPLSNESGFKRKIEAFVDMDYKEWRATSEKARLFGKEYFFKENALAIASYKILF